MTEQEVAETVAALLELVAFVIRTAPKVREFWNDHALPTIRSKWETRPRRALPASPPADLQAPEVNTAAVPDPDQAADSETQDDRVPMSSQEARARLLLALTARRISDEQIEALLDARIGTDEGVGELHRALAELTPREMSRITAALETPPAVLGSVRTDLLQNLGAEQSDRATNDEVPGWDPLGRFRQKRHRPGSQPDSGHTAKAEPD